MPIVDTLRRLVQKTMEASIKDWEHVERVYKLSTIIAKKEGADVELCQVGALLHDIGVVIGEPHNLTGQGRAKVLLRGMSYPSAKIDHVMRIIEHHCFSGRNKLESIEEKIVWDADKLDSIGAIGIARAFHMRGEKGLMFHDFTWFKEDTLIQFERLNTGAAKEIGKLRIEYMASFFDTLKIEIDMV